MTQTADRPQTLEAVARQMLDRHHFDGKSQVDALVNALRERFGDASAIPGGLKDTYPTGTFNLPSTTQPTALSQWGGSAGRIAAVHATVSSALHAVSTIKMGPPSETQTGSRSCLDQYGRLYGIKNLAVCDNCAHPTTTRGNPWLPTVGLAENMTAEWIARGGLDF